MRRSLADLREAFYQFAAAPASARPLSVFRISLCLILLAHAAAISANLGDFYGLHGIVQEPVSRALAHPGLPDPGVLLRFIASLGMSEDAALRLVFFTYVLSLHVLLLGLWTRLSALSGWWLYLTLRAAGAASDYGAIEFAHIALFYCVVLPVGDCWSLDSRGRREMPSPGARLGRRILQLHLCIAYFASGLEKALGSQWWNGEAVWQAVMRPARGVIHLSWLASHPGIAVASGWSTLLIELGYMIMVWPRATRKIWVGLTISLHLGIAVCMGLWFFASVMIVFNIAAFLVDDPCDRRNVPPVMPQA